MAQDATNEIDPAALAYALAQLRAEGNDEAVAELLHLAGIDSDVESDQDDEQDAGAANEPEPPAPPRKESVPARVGKCVARVLAALED